MYNYNYFELGFCDHYGITTDELGTEHKEMLKQAYDEYAPAYSNEAPQPAPAPKSHWKQWLAGGLGLAAAGAGAYLYGSKGNNALSGFANGVDTNVLHPAKGFIDTNIMNPIHKALTPPKSMEDELTSMNDKAQEAGLLNAWKNAKHVSDLHGTPLEGMTQDQFDEIGHKASIPGEVANQAYNADMAARLARFAKVPGAARGMAAVGSIPGMGAVGKALPVAAATSAIPDGLQLGDKLNDHYNIENPYARTAIKGGVALAPLAAAGAGAWAGAEGGAAIGAGIGSFAGPVGTAAGGLIGGSLGGIGGFIAPMAYSIGNSSLNRNNAMAFANNRMTGMKDSLTPEFQRALTEKANGNYNAMNAWYKIMHEGGKDAFNQKMESFKDNPALRQQILDNDTLVGTPGN